MTTRIHKITCNGLADLNHVIDAFYVALRAKNKRVLLAQGNSTTNGVIQHAIEVGPIDYLLIADLYTESLDIKQIVDHSIFEDVTVVYSIQKDSFDLT